MGTSLYLFLHTQKKDCLTVMQKLMLHKTFTHKCLSEFVTLQNVRLIFFCIFEPICHLKKNLTLRVSILKYKGLPETNIINLFSMSLFVIFLSRKNLSNILIVQVKQLKF